jgi:hypothetical protein
MSIWRRGMGCRGQSIHATTACMDPACCRQGGAAVDPKGARMGKGWGIHAPAHLLLMWLIYTWLGWAYQVVNQHWSSCC